MHRTTYDQKAKATATTTTSEHKHIRLCCLCVRTLQTDWPRWEGERDGCDCKTKTKEKNRRSFLLLLLLLLDVVVLCFCAMLFWYVPRDWERGIPNSFSTRDLIKRRLLWTLFISAFVVLWMWMSMAKMEFGVLGTRRNRQIGLQRLRLKCKYLLMYFEFGPISSLHSIVYATPNSRHANCTDGKHI